MIRITLINRTDGGVDVHRPGCADIKRMAANTGDDPWTLEVETALELSLAYWGDVISDEVDPNTPEGHAVAASYIQLFNFLPCCPAFPTEETPAMNAHTFARSADDSKRCSTCGKTRNVKAHTEAKMAEVIDQHRADVAARQADEAAQTDEKTVEEETQGDATQEAAELRDAAATGDRAALDKMNAAADALRAEPTISVWVGWRVADEAMGRSDDDPAAASLAAKLRDRAPNKVLDRTVKLTRAECEALSAAATDLENAVLGAKGAGPVAYSCRTLRDRLAAAWA